MTPDECIALASRYQSAAEGTRDPTARLQLQRSLAGTPRWGRALKFLRSRVTVEHRYFRLADIAKLLPRKRTSKRRVGMSAKPPKSDIKPNGRRVRFVPQPDSCGAG